MNNVMTPQKAKGDWLQIRISEQLKEDFRIAAELRGLTSSALVHSFIVKTVREEKEISPEAFRKNEPPVNETDQAPKRPAPVVAHIGSGTTAKKDIEPTKRDAQRMIDEAQVAEIERRLKPRRKPPEIRDADYVRDLGELSDDTSKQKQTPRRKKAGR